jgi:hypothetical protein
MSTPEAQPQPNRENEMAKSYANFEIVCIARHGSSIRATSGVDAAASVTYHGFNRGEVHDASDAVKSFWLVPIGRPGDYADSYGRV